MPLEIYIRKKILLKIRISIFPNMSYLRLHLYYNSVRILKFLTNVCVTQHNTHKKYIGFVYNIHNINV